MDVSNEIINADYNVSPVMFASETRLLVRSLFNTIQGEMPFAGEPATFLRLGGCNRGAKLDIGCAGCDTSFRVDESEWYDAAEIAELVYHSLIKDNRLAPRLLVITGGEPILQADALIPFFNRLEELDADRYSGIAPLRVQFESNGDFDPRPMFRKVPSILDETITVFCVLSPKSPFKKNPWWLQEDVFVEGTFYIRRVVNGEVNSTYYDVPYQIRDIADVWGHHVYLSPQTFYKAGAKQEEGNSRDHIDWERTDAAVKRAVELASNLGCNVSFQVHAYLNIR